VIVATVAPEGKRRMTFPVHDYLVKPVEAEDLLASLAHAGVAPTGARPVLVVDADPAVLNLTGVALRQLGYRPLCAGGGAEALRVADSDPPDAVVVDLLMPEMDGFEFLTRFRTSAAGRGVPIIVWTAKDLSLQEQAALKSSAHAIVSRASGGMAPLVEELRLLLEMRETEVRGHGR
jgi:CheY-like chemotaxis protein